jgi:uncharacterized protein
MDSFNEITGFVWDSANRDKIFHKHSISTDECEGAFLEPQRQFYPDIAHSHSETRHIVVGKSNRGRILYIAFTLRKHIVRIISARPINKKELYLYE